MNETLGRGYARIEAIRTARGEPLSSMANPSAPPPDTYNIVYLTLFCAGAAFLLPFNSFIMAVDYFQYHYPQSTIMFDMSTVYIASACVAVVINNMLLDVFSYNTRITFVPLPAVYHHVRHVDSVHRVRVRRRRHQQHATRRLLLQHEDNVWYVPLTYFQYHYPQSTIMFDMSTVYIASACVAVVINNMLLDVFSYNTRITFGMFLLLTSSTTTRSLPSCSTCRQCTSRPRASPSSSTTCSLTSSPTTREQLLVSYTINLIAIGVVAFGCTVQQASYYGFTGCLPPRYTQAQMFDTPTRSTFMFFVFSILILLLHSMLHHMAMRNPLVQHYLKITTESKQKRRIQLHLNPNEDATLPAISEPSGSPSAASPRPSYKVEDVVFEPPERPTSWRAIKRGILDRWAVARAIYPYMVSIGLVYFATLALYPGIASEVQSCELGTWMPIVLMAFFNMFDFIGKIAAAWPYEWSRSQLLMASGVRLLLVPLLLLCAAPRYSPHIVGDIAAAWPYEWSRSQLLMASGVRLLLVPLLLLCAAPRYSPHIVGDVYPIMFSVVLGFTNGLFGSVPMIVAPSRCSYKVWNTNLGTL
ncbi:Equilibrative nucleoside transporter 4 [Operophtera brumata]|uniref:Equilibrative nucleoside transporter 4 n=1 Tax=Operophtera brumata TaxID=104452 RepID=A0A0L7LD10_OPEBR|nr:Equilibrative nucleoside transporter 4 [Operophtera brumata]